MDDADRVAVEWRDIAEAIPGGVAIQSGRTFVYVSQAFASTVGTDPDAIVDEDWRVLFDPEEATRLDGEPIETARAGGEWTGDVRTGGPHAEMNRLELTLSKTEQDALVWHVSESEDAADLPTGPQPNVQPEIARSVLDIVEDVVFVIDDDDRLRFWNQALVDTTGYSHEEIDGMRPMEFIPEDEHEQVPGLLEAVEGMADRRVQADIRTADGDRITHEFRGTTFEDPVSGERFRCGIARDVTERRDLERYERIIETIDDGIYALDSDFRFSFVNQALCEMTDRSRTELLGTVATELLVDENELTIAEQIRERLAEQDTLTGTVRGTLETPDGDRQLEARYRLYPEPDEAFRGSIGVVRDVTGRDESEETLDRRANELTTLERINEVLLETVRELVQTSSREAVERTICQRLTESDLYQFAWVGEPELGGDQIVPRTSAGMDGGYLEDVTITQAEGIPGHGPGGEAVRSGEVQVANVDDPVFEPWREQAKARGFESVAAVPLKHGETVYGVLFVYATREDAFSEREQSGFDVLGRTVGFAIHSDRNRELLFADSVVKLDFDVTGCDTMLADIGSDLDCQLTLDGYVASGEQWILYLGVSNADPAAVVDTTTDLDIVEQVRVIGAGADGHGRIELVIGDSQLLHTATAVGASVRTATISPDEARITLEAPADIEVRELVERVQSDYPGADLLSRKKLDRDVRTMGRPESVLEELTSRQRDAMEAAYHAGYFAWPRETTAEEVADSLDLTPPTLHGHLRKAEYTVLSHLLDGS